MTSLFRRWHRDRLERELDIELRFHVDEEAARLQSQGAPASEARRIALAQFGGIEPIKEVARDVRGTRWLEDLTADLRYALRTMRRYPAFAFAAILSLAIGIGANTAIFSVLHALLLQPLPVDSPQQLAYLVRDRRAFDPDLGGRAKTRASNPFFLRLRKALEPSHTSLASMTPPTNMQATIGTGDAEIVSAQLVSGGWFDVLGAGAVIGRVLAPTDDAAGAPGVAVISDGFWTRRFARDPSVIGSTFRLNAVPVTVVGVAQPQFTGFVVGDPVDAWVPTALQADLHYAFNADIEDSDQTKPWGPQEGIAWLTLVARVQPPETRSGASAIVDTLFRSEVAAKAPSISDPRQRAYALSARVHLADGSSGMSDLRNEFGRAVVVLMITVALVLLVACANLANLLMARSAARVREFAVRLSLGARRSRLIRQLLTESLLLSVGGGIASLVLARAGAGALLRMASSGPNPLALDVSITWPIVAFAIGASVVTGLLFGAAPAVRFSRADLYDAIRSSSGAVGRRRERVPFGRLLVVGQVAVSLALLVAAALFVRTLHNLLSMDPGFQAAHLVTARFDARLAGYTPATLPALHQRLLEGARRMRGVQVAATAMCGTMANCHSISDIDVPGRVRGVGDDADVQEDFVDGDYFPALGMTFVAGRNFGPSDDERAPHVAIVNEAMAHHFFGDANPIGRHFKNEGDFEIVGVVGDSHINGLREAPPRMAFYPYSQNPGRPVRTLYVRVAGEVAPAIQNIRAVFRTADRGIAVREVVTLSDLEQRSVARERLVSSLTAVFGLLAVAVACLGLYGTVSYSVSRRTNEIGIRLALGASVGNVRWLVLRETLVLVAVGIGLGLAMTLPALRLLDAMVYGIAARDLTTMVASAAGLAAVAIASGGLPAWKASNLSPTVALRTE